MGKKARGKHRLDKFYHLAKEQGYRSRASFKLIQLNRRYGFLNNCKSVIDLCAAPGGWLQVAAKHMPVNSLCIGVDLDPIRPIRGCQTFVGDITTQTCRATLKKMLNGEKCDCVLHDGAPNVGGAWSSEAATQTTLVLESLKLASEFLVPKGAFVTKIFRSKDYNALMYAFKQLFNKVEAHKPAASRNTSAEIFVVCMGYKAPAKIDPRLLDHKHLFAEVEDNHAPTGPDALARGKMKQRRHRDGYEEGVTNLRKETSAVAFVTGDNPVEMLGIYNKFHLTGKASLLDEDTDNADDGAWQASFVASHSASNNEIQALAEDLQVLGRKEYKQLLKWRLSVRKDLFAEIAKRKKEAGEDSDEGGEDAGDGEEDEEADPEQEILDEMEAIKERMDRHQRKMKKRKQKLKKRARERASAATGTADDLLDAQAEGLFSLKSIRGKESIQSSESAPAPHATALEELESSESEVSEAESEGSIDMEEEQRRYDALMDEYLEESYKQYQERRGQNKDTGRKKKRRRVGDEEDGEMGEDAGGGEELAGNRYDSSDEEDNELVVSLDKGKKGEAGSEGDVASQWFSQDVFQSLEDMDEETAAPFGAKKGAKKAAKGVPKGKKPAAKRSKVDDVSGAGGEKGAGLKAPSPAEGVADEEDSDFEVVPQAPSDDESNSDSDDEFDYMSDDAKAEILAIATKMMKRKVKDNIVEAAYNRFAFHDEGLPKWFEADEFRHMRPNPILSKSELDAERDRMKAIDSRPIKKVAEAKARKRKRTAVRLDKARSKATVIAGNEDMPSSAKLREIEKLYAQAKNTGYKAKGKKKPTRMERQKSSGPPKDGRLRADQARGKKAQKMKKAAKGGKGKGGKR